MNSMIVNEHILHLEIRALRVPLVAVLYECVLQRVARPLVPNHLAAQQCPEPAENERERLIVRDGVEFADEKHILRRRNLRKR